MFSIKQTVISNVESLLWNRVNQSVWRYLDRSANNLTWSFISQDVSSDVWLCIKNSVRDNIVLKTERYVFRQ